MDRILKHLGQGRQALLALFVVALMPAVLEAAGIGFQNNATYPVYVQGSTVVNGQVKRGPLLYLKPGDTAWDVNLTNGTRTIVVYNTANQKLNQVNVMFQGMDQFYLIQPAVVPRGQPARVDLRPAAVPKKGPGAPGK